MDFVKCGAVRLLSAVVCSVAVTAMAYAAVNSPDVVWVKADKAAFEGMFARCIEKLSIYDIYYSFSVGTFDLSAVVYYISIMGVCLFLTVQSLERKRYN